MTAQPAAMPPSSTNQGVRARLGHQVRHASTRGLAAVAVVALLVGSVPPGPADAIGGLRIMVTDTCLSTQGPVNTSTHLIWRAANGKPKGEWTLTSNSQGQLEVSCDVPVVGGDRIAVTAGSLHRTLTVPPLTARFDRVSHRVSGRGPAGGTLQISVEGGSKAHPTRVSCTTSTVVSALGVYSVDVEAIAPGGACPARYTTAGGDFAYVSWTDGLHDVVEVAPTAQLVEVTIGEAGVAGYLLPGATVTFELRTTTRVLRGSATVHGDAWGGEFGRDLRDAQGHLVPIRVGDRLSGDWARHVELVIPDMHFTFWPIYNWVFGWCLPDAPYLLELQGGDASVDAVGATDTHGETAAVAWSGRPRAGDHAFLDCLLPSTDSVSFSQVMP